MGEIKSVKVDNWGVFFLQKLQNFFNKTDYCDLTLQFKDNSQLKVHRLVLSACTDFFNVLEQTCEFVDDALVMPNELQADVVVPIVNFMYTGTLEFELKMYCKLLKTAKEMNMTVLLKLLEAHRRTMESATKAQTASAPKAVRGRGRPVSSAGPQQRAILSSPSNTVTTQRRILPANVQQKRTVQTATTATSTMTNRPTTVAAYFRQSSGTTLLKQPITQTKLQKGPVRYECADSNNLSETYETSFDSISYESKPIKEEEEEEFGIQTSILPVKKRSSPFEQLRSEGYNNNKRPANITLLTPPVKKPNIEDVKEFAEQQRMRKQIAAEYGDDHEYEGIMDDDIHNDDDDDDCATASTVGTVTTPIVTVSQTSHKQQQSGPSLIIKHEPNEKPTIVVKDSTDSSMNHAKIISEVLRQYPHLVKSNKNIKLKIMPNSSGRSQKIIVKKEIVENAAVKADPKSIQVSSHIKVQKQKTIEKIIPSQIQQQTQSKANTTPNTTVQPAEGQKRRIDSKTMHALIAQGAENTTGPWLCLRCGINGRPISIPSYRGFRRHLINTHKEKIDPALCEFCGWRSTDNKNLHFHMHVEHKQSSTVYTFPECSICSNNFIDAIALNFHMVENHPDDGGNKQQCIYCNKIFAKEMQLLNHIKTNHKQNALEDGIIDFSDDEFVSDDAVNVEWTQTNNEEKKKIKIISDISLPSTVLKLEPSSEAAALSTVASGIATSILGIENDEFISAPASSNEMKILNADGNEMVLSAEQREQILSQLNQEHEGSVVMILNDTAIIQHSTQTATAATTTTATATATEDDDKTNDGSTNKNASSENEDNTMEEENLHEDVNESTVDDSNYEQSHVYDDDGAVDKDDEATTAVEKGENLTKSTKSKDSNDDTDNDHMEWAENLISAQDLADESEEQDKNDAESKENESQKSEEHNLPADKPRKDDDISMKLKLLTGDWSDDEMEDDPIEASDTTAIVKKNNAKIDTNIEKSKEEDETKNEEKIAKETKTPPPAEEKISDNNLVDLKTILTDPIVESIKLKNDPETNSEIEIKQQPNIEKDISVESCQSASESSDEKMDKIKSEVKEEKIEKTSPEKDDNDDGEKTKTAVTLGYLEPSLPSASKETKTTESTPSKSEDRVKSLISDWGDDEEEEEEDL